MMMIMINHVGESMMMMMMMMMMMRRRRRRRRRIDNVGESMMI